MAEEGRPNVYIVAGPNGAGKSTFARRFLPEYADCKEFVNADLIAVPPLPPSSRSWLIFDNSGDSPRSIAFGLGNERYVIDAETFGRIEREAERYDQTGR